MARRGASGLLNHVPHNIIVFPGHLCNERMYSPLIRSLEDLASVQVADLYQHDSLAQITSAALAGAPDRFTVVANSMGGAVAFEAIRQAPERIEALLLIGTTAQPEFPSQGERRARAIQLAGREDWTAVAALYAPVFFYEQNRKGDVTLDETLEAMIRDQDAIRIGRQQRAFSARPDSRPTLSSITCPTLILCGREDAMTPVSHSEEMAAAIPGAELQILDRCGHIPTLEQPERTKALVRTWLTERVGFTTDV